MKMSFGWFLLVVHFWIDNVKGCSVMPLDIWIEDVYLLDIDNTSLLVETSNNTCYLFNVDNQIQSYQVLCEDFIDYYRDFTPFDIDPTTTSITSITLNEQSSISTDGSYIDIAMKRNGESLTITSYFIPEIIETEHERINYLFWTINQYNVTIILIQSIVDMAIAIHFDIKNNNNNNNFNNFNNTNTNNNNTDSNNNEYIIKTIELKGNDDIYYGVYSNVGKKAVGQPVIESLNLVSLDIFMYACYNNIYSIYNLWFETDSHNNKLIKSIELNNLGAAYLVIDIKHQKAYDYIGVLISDYLHTYTFSDENENIIEAKNDTMTYYVESYHIDFEVPFDDTIYPSTTAYYTTTATATATTTIATTATTTQETIDTTDSPDTTNNHDTTEAAYITTTEITDVKDTTDSPDSPDTSESTSDSADTIRITEIRETRNTNTNSSSGFGFNTDIFGSDTDDSDETDEAISIKNTKLIACEKIIYCCIFVLVMSDIF